MRYLKNLGKLLIFIISGAVILSIFGWAILHFRGVFAKWQNLGQPPEKPAEVLEIWYVQTATGVIYHHPYYLDCQSNCWEEVDSVDESTRDESLSLPIDHCEWYPSTRRYDVSMVSCGWWGVGRLGQIFAIDSNGDVFYWENPIDESAEILRFLSPFVGGVLGFITGVLYLILSSLIKKRQNTTLRTDVL